MRIYKLFQVSPIVKWLYNRWFCLEMYGSHEMFQVENATNTKVTPLSKDAGNYKWSSHLWCLKATDFVASRIRNWHLGDFSKTKAQIASPWSTQDPKMPWESTSEKYGEILSIQLAPRELEVLKIHQTWKRKSVAGFFFHGHSTYPHARYPHEK